MIDQPPPAIAVNPPPPLPGPVTGAVALRQFIVMLLSLCLGLFLADALISLADDSLILFFNVHVLSILRSLIGLFTLLLAVIVYGAMALTPMIPKRLFLPVALFTPVSFLAGIPCLIYAFDRLQQFAWAVSLCELFCALGIIIVAQGGWKLRWPLISQQKLKPRPFSWGNLSVFVLANLFILLPAVIFYLGYCAALGVDHFSEGFVKLRPGGLSVSVRKYVRDDGKTIQLFPMSHVADAAFYRQISASFPTNSIILLEGVTDTHNLLTNKISYHHMAKALGLSEQQKEFKPDRGEPVRADVDVDQFTPRTIEFLNFVMLIHSKGLTPENLSQLMKYPAPPGFENLLFNDLLHKRNQHLLGEIQAHLLHADYIVVPWGAAHMPELAHEIQQAGFHLSESREYINIRFHVAPDKNAVRKSGGEILK